MKLTEPVLVYFSRADRAALRTAAKRAGRSQRQLIRDATLGLVAKLGKAR